MPFVDAREPREALGEEGGPANEPVLEAERVGPQLGEPRLDVELVVEERRDLVLYTYLDDGEVNASPRPIGVRHTTTAQPLDATGLEVHEVGRMMNDPHQIGLAEAGSKTEHRHVRVHRRLLACHPRIMANAKVRVDDRGGLCSAVVTKRRLPVLSTASEPTEPPRPSWQWSGFGAAAVFVAWLPLASLAEWVKGRAVTAFLGPTSSAEETAARIAALEPGDRARLTVIVLGLPAVALVVGAYAGGYLVGRFGDGVRARHGAGAGALAGLVAALLACVAAGPSLAPFAAVPLAALPAAVGALHGLRTRTRSRGAGESG